jgi:hypothetical protein
MANILGALALTSGSNSLKAINGNVVNNNDICLVVTSDGFYVYQMVTPDSTTESVPAVISPTNNGGNKRWHLRSSRYFTANVEFAKTSELKIHDIKEKDSDGIAFLLSNGTEMLRVDSDGVHFNHAVISTINDIPMTDFITADGNVTFTSQIKGVDPVADEDLTTKHYVDTAIDTRLLVTKTFTLEAFNFFAIDDTLTNVVESKTWDIVPTKAMSPDGAITAFFNIPEYMDIDQDVFINCFYSLTSPLSGTGEYVDLLFEIWSIAVDTTPSASDYSYTKSIISSTANIDKLAMAEFTEPYIPATILSDHTDLIVLKITNKSTSSYSGTFDLIKLQFYQN